jgi:Family of unknown function (DUF6623)
MSSRMFINYQSSRTILGIIKSFIHGNAVIPEILGPGPGPFIQIEGCPWSEFLGLPSGYGKTFRGAAGKSTWFHAAIPTPPVEYTRVQLDKVYVFFFGQPGCTMDQVHVYDGPDGIATITTTTSGDNLRNPTQQNSFPIRVEPRNSFHTMNFGLGVSMHFRFDSESEVQFSSVGSDFLTTVKGV